MNNEASITGFGQVTNDAVFYPSPNSDNLPEIAHTHLITYLALLFQLYNVLVGLQTMRTKRF